MKVKITFWYDGDMSVGIKPHHATLEIELPVMDEAERDGFCDEISQTLSKVSDDILFNYYIEELK